MKQHFVTFYSPGSFVNEETTKPIDKWDINQAKEMALTIIERYNATPFAFEFSTRQRKKKDLDSKEIERSPRYWLGGKIETLAEVEARATEKDTILVSNMRNNGYKKVITNNNSWKYTAPFKDDDIVLA